MIQPGRSPDVHMDWLRSIPPFPPGGVSLELEYRRNTGAATRANPTFNALLEPLLGQPLIPGSLNLWSTRNLELPEPVTVINGAWHFWPAVLGEKAAGVVARRTDTFNPKFLEVISNLYLVSTLGIQPRDLVPIRVLPGQLLPVAI